MYLQETQGLKSEDVNVVLIVDQGVLFWNPDVCVEDFHFGPAEKRGIGMVWARDTCDDVTAQMPL